MNNFEYIARNRDINSNDCICEIAHECKYGKDCVEKSCDGCEFNGNVHHCLEVLLAEHKEKIKLKQWEYDMLVIRKNDGIYGYHPLNGSKYIKEMQKLGYFKDVDLNKSAREMLENCEVEER